MSYTKVWALVFVFMFLALFFMALNVKLLLLGGLMLLCFIIAVFNFLFGGR